MAYFSGIRGWLLLAALSVLLVPLFVYFGGSLLAGPYEGESGLPGLLASIWGDGLRGRPAALLLLLAPVLLVIIWRAALFLRHSAGGPATGGSRPQGQ